MDIIAPHILVVDDSPAILNMLSNLLMKQGYRVTSALSGEEALQVFSSCNFDMVLTDIILPGMSGMQLLKLMKDIKPEVEIVLISSNASSYTAIKAMRLGAYDYIVKPIDDQEILLNVVRRTLEKQSLSKENRRLISHLSENNCALQEALDMMKTVNRVCAKIAASMEISEILNILVESAVQQLNAATGYLLLLDKEGKRFSMKISVGIDPRLANSFSLSRDGGISGLAASENKVIRTSYEPVSPLSRRMLEEDANSILFAPPGIISAPLQLNSKVVGVVTISGRTSGKQFTDTEAEFLSILANHAAIALVNAGNFYRLKKNVDIPRLQPDASGFASNAG